MKESIKVYALMFLDAVLISISLTLAYILRFNMLPWEVHKVGMRYLVFVYAAVLVVKLGCSYAFRLYKILWRYASIQEVSSIIASAFIGSVAAIVSVVVFRINIAKSVLMIAFFIDVTLIGGIRFTYRLARLLVSDGILHRGDYKRTMIIGGGEAGAIVIKQLKLNPEMKIRPVSIIDDDVSKVGRKINGVPIVGGRSRICEEAVKRDIELIIIAMPSAGKKVINEISSECLKTRCKVKILPSIFQIIDESVLIQKIRDVNIEDLLGREPVKIDSAVNASYLKDRVVLVTGGGGSIGSELCRQIAAVSPRQLIILDNYENSTYEIQNELQFRYPGLNLVTVIANIRERSRIESIFEAYRPSVVFHAAAHKHVPLMEGNPVEAIKNNVLGTLNVAECSSKYKIKKFVLISTDKAVNPTNIMGATKRIAEMFIQAFNKFSSTEFVAVRFGNVLGSNGSVIPLFKKQIEQGGPVTVTHPEVTRFFMTISEAVQLVIQAGAMAEGGEIFVLDMGQPVKIYDLARNLIRLSGFEPDEDIKIVFTGLRPGEKLYEELLLAEEGLMTTENNKIYIAKPLFTDLALLKREIEILLDVVAENSEEVSDYLLKIVPTYRKA